MPFREKFAVDCKQLYIGWLQKYFVVKPYGEHQLSFPIKAIIYCDYSDGYIFLANGNDNSIGNAALMKGTDRSYEVTKMPVARDGQR